MSAFHFIKGIAHCKNGQEVSVEDAVSFARIESEQGKGVCEIAEIHFFLQEAALRKDCSLRKDSPLSLWLSPEEEVLQMTAMYMLNDWWTRPAFVTSFAEIPERTQVLFMKYRQDYACLVPMVGHSFKSYVTRGEAGQLCLEMRTTLDGLKEIEEPLYVYARGESLEEAVENAFAYLIGQAGIRSRRERRLPESFQYLGWCSWDAFYRDINEGKVREKAAELAAKKVPIRWMLMDDGWMSMNLDDEVLQNYAPDPAKFPQAFGQMIRDIKKETEVKWFGVWHALPGFWKGVEEQSPVYEQEKEHLYTAANGRIIPNPMGSGEHFYRDWYDLLSRQGIDFVKVDGQSSFWDFADGSLPIGPAAKGMHQALEGGASYMDGAIINCMGMGMENILSRPASAVSRNSDDFVPDKENGFAEHLLQNAYNSIYHNEVYVCDWDMFWTRHADADKHALLRAVSGGPVYVSDKIGETCPETLAPLAYSDGRLLMMKQSARPTPECLFTDPMKEGVLKLYNIGDWADEIGGGIAAYNLTGSTQTYTISPADVKGITKAEKYYVYDYFTREGVLIGATESLERSMEAGGYAWYIILPAHKHGVCLGLLDKYAGFTAVKRIIETEDRCTVILEEGGTVGWLTGEGKLSTMTGQVENYLTI